MSWAIHYAIALDRALTPAESDSLEQLCLLRSFSLHRIVSGPGRMLEWKGLISDEELVRLEASHRASSEKDEGWDFRGFIQLGSLEQLCRIIEWMREVEALLPVRVFEVKEDYSITQKCRPSEVDLDRLKSKAKSEQQEPEPSDEPDDPAAEALLEEGEALRRAKLEEQLEQARRDFAIWKNAQPR